MTNAALGQAFTIAAYLVGALVFWLDARRQNIATEGVGIVALWGLCGGVLGAKLCEWILSHSALLITQPQLFLDPRMGGRTVIGGVIGGWICVEIAKKRLGIRRSTGDSFALALPAGEAIGRVGCFFNGCCYGVICDKSAFSIWQHGAWRVPTQMLLGLAAAAIFVIVLWARPRMRAAQMRDGRAWILYLALFGWSRFLLEFWREREPVFSALSMAQIVCLLLAISSTRSLWKRAQKPEKLNFAPAKQV